MQSQKQEQLRQDKFMNLRTQDERKKLAQVEQEFDDFVETSRIHSYEN